MNRGGVADFVLGGWQLGGILTLQDGFPFTLGCGTGTMQNGGGGCYPDPAPGSPDWQLPASERSRTRWFNTAAFVDRNPEFGTGFRYGTVSGIRSSDPASTASTCRSTRTSTSPTNHLEFRIEVFNLPNLPIWGQPGTQLGTPNYGVITSTRMDSRQIQLGLKYVFYKGSPGTRTGSWSPFHPRRAPARRSDESALGVVDGVYSRVGVGPVQVRDRLLAGCDSEKLFTDIERSSDRQADDERLGDLVRPRKPQVRNLAQGRQRRRGASPELDGHFHRPGRRSDDSLRRHD